MIWTEILLRFRLNVLLEKGLLKEAATSKKNLNIHQ